MSAPSRLRPGFLNNPFDDGTEQENMALICQFANAQFNNFVPKFAPDFSFNEASKWSSPPRVDERRPFNPRFQRNPHYHSGNRQNRGSPHWKQPYRQRHSPHSVQSTPESNCSTDQPRAPPAQRWFQKSPFTNSPPPPAAKKDLKFTPIKTSPIAPPAWNIQTRPQLKAPMPPYRAAVEALLKQELKSKDQPIPIPTAPVEEQHQENESEKTQKTKKKRIRKKKKAWDQKENQPEVPEETGKKETEEQNSDKPCENNQSRRQRAPLVITKPGTTENVEITPPSQPVQKTAWNLKKPDNPPKQHQIAEPEELQKAPSRRGQRASFHAKPADAKKPSEEIANTPKLSTSLQSANAQEQTPFQARRSLRITHPSGALRTPPSNEVQFKYVRFSQHQRQQRARFNRDEKSF